MGEGGSRAPPPSYRGQGGARGGRLGRGQGQRLCGAIGPPEVGGAQGLLLPPHIATRACILPVFVTMWRVLNKMPAPGSAGPATKYTLNKRPTDT